MQYSSISQLPKHVREFRSKKRKQIWMYTFNAVLRQTRSEGRARRAANG